MRVSVVVVITIASAVAPVFALPMYVRSSLRSKATLNRDCPKQKRVRHRCASLAVCTHSPNPSEPQLRCLHRYRRSPDMVDSIYARDEDETLLYRRQVTSFSTLPAY